VFGTLSKLLARAFLVYGLGGQDTGGDGDSGLRELIVKIHSSRTHAYTDSILEYRLEVAPAQLVRLASAGIQGLRKPADTTYDVLPSESEDESGGDPELGHGEKKETRHRPPTGARQPPAHVDASVHGPSCAPGTCRAI
jgi:Holliday junction resolvase YEN1